MIFEHRFRLSLYAKISSIEIFHLFLNTGYIMYISPESSIVFIICIFIVDVRKYNLYTGTCMTENGECLVYVTKQIT